MQSVAEFVQAYRPFLDMAAALSAFINILGWCVGAVLISMAWRRAGIRAVSFGPLSFQMQEAAVEAAAVAARNWQRQTPSQKIDVERIRDTVGRAFEPEIQDKLIGKSVLWVDDNPINNELVVRALRRLKLDVVQVENTDDGVEMLQRRRFDLVISDMGRGDNMTAGYDLLARVRAMDPNMPFLIFAGSDTPEFRAEALRRGAQLSTNDMLELLDTIVDHLGK